MLFASFVVTCAITPLINKLEKYNGCILADSVGLGKTFTALAVIKYYENRNKRRRKCRRKYGLGTDKASDCLQIRTPLK